MQLMRIQQRKMEPLSRAGISPESCELFSLENRLKSKIWSKNIHLTSLQIRLMVAWVVRMKFSKVKVALDSIVSDPQTSAPTWAVDLGQEAHRCSNIS